MNYDVEENFIRVYENSVSREFCEGLIKYFEWANENDRTWERGEANPLLKKDKSTCLNPPNYWDINFCNEHLTGYIREFNESFWNKCYPSYVKEFDIINGISRHTIHAYKIQKTMPSEGYHVWHCEVGSIEHSRRIITYILYLNDVVEGGETEFLYQRKRIVPKEGTLVLFPAAYTHTHRGNPPLRGSKYIMTGWIELS